MQKHLTSKYLKYYTLFLACLATLATLVFYLVFKKFEFKWYYIIGLFILNFLFIYFSFSNQLKKLLYEHIKEVYQKSPFASNQDVNNDDMKDELELLSSRIELFAESSEGQIKQLTERENYRREFIGNVAHELRTPLFTAQSFVLTLMEGAADNEKLRKDYLNRVNRSIDRLVHIVEDLGMINQLESGQVLLSPQEFDIQALIAEIVEILAIKADEYKTKIIFEASEKTNILVQADKERIEQVLVNLIVNAIKHGKEKGIIRVYLEEKADQVFISVQDNGDGIPEEDQSRIFERFYRVEKSRSRTKGGGSGLGLSITKHIIEAHHQNISLQSEYGNGATFTFSLAKV